ncbi:TetR/AcrR family transcriptional regulator [Azospirillum endophyticum]
MRTKAQAVQSTEKVEARSRLLDSAERLFAQHGYNGVSLRAITEDAQVNIASAHYYFGSKEELLRAVFERRVTPLNAERHRRLDIVLAEAADGRPDPTRVIEAFLAPAFKNANAESTAMFALLSGRASTDPSPEVRRVLFESHHETATRFVDLLHKSYPELTRQELFWRLSCIYGALTYVTSNNGRLQYLMGDDLSMSDSDEAIRHVIPFLAAGFLRPRDR